MIPFPNKKYNIIYADPPWKYNARTNTKTKFGGGAENKYETMTKEEIWNLPINTIADKNCYLFLWVTFPKLLMGIKTIEEWGFVYKTLGFSYIKTNKTNNKPFFGVGYYTKSNCEVCLLATKGKVKPVSNYVSSVVIEPRYKHSKKPNSIRNKIVQLCGDLPRIELFARQRTDGWDVWGDEV